jgi:hypothetical protein
MTKLKIATVLLILFGLGSIGSGIYLVITETELFVSGMAFILNYIGVSFIVISMAINGHIY